MTSRKPNLTRIAALIALVSAVPTVSQAQTPVADYQLQNNYASSVGTIGDLVPLGTGVSFATATVDGNSQYVLSIAPTGLTADSGAQTQTAGFVSSMNYSVVLQADFDLQLTGLAATKVLDFKNLSSDAGLYINDATGILEFVDGTGIPFADGGLPVTSGTFLTIALTRDGKTGLTSIFENGALAFSFTDTTGLAILGDGSTPGSNLAYLTTFADDGGGLGGTLVNEGSIGDLARLQIFDGVLSVPEPSTWMLALAGSALLLGYLRRSRRAFLL